MTTDERLLKLETEFRTELKHLATKADLKALELRLIATVVTVVGVAVAILKLWN